MTCNIQFVFVKRWSIFCNYRTVFELQQYPRVLTIVVSHPNLEIISILLGLKRIRRIRANSHMFSKRIFGDKLLSS